jgi:hypothetical protein
MAMAAQRTGFEPATFEAGLQPSAVQVEVHERYCCEIIERANSHCDKSFEKKSKDMKYAYIYINYVT